MKQLFSDNLPTIFNIQPYSLSPWKRVLHSKLFLFSFNCRCYVDNVAVASLQLLLLQLLPPFFLACAYLDLSSERTSTLFQAYHRLSACKGANKS
eukprot:01185_4